MQKLLKRVYVWEFPVRLTHWLNTLSILTLMLTGYYIGDPFISVSGEGRFVMGWVRFAHFVSAYVFTVSTAVRVYWAFMGNRYANWRVFLPFSAEKSVRLINQMLYYSFLTKKKPFYVGHNPLAGLTYLMLFALYIVAIITGFAHYSLYNPGGLYGTLFGWVFLLMTGPSVRLIHHMAMWLLVYFILIHIYLAILTDSMDKSGLMGSIFTGHKFVYPEVKE